MSDKKGFIVEIANVLTQQQRLKEEMKDILAEAKENGMDVAELKYFAKLRADMSLFDEERKLEQKEEQLSEYRKMFPEN